MSLLGAIGSIAGGLLGKSKTIDPRESVTLHTRGIRQASEWYGFNPLTLLQNVAPSSTVTGPNPMGSAIADAAMFAADAFLQRGNQQALLVNEYQRQNKELQDRLTHVTLQPKVPGVYGGGDAVSGAGAAVAGISPAVSAGAAGGPRPLVDVDEGFGADSRRGVKNEDVKSHPGYILLDNPNLPMPMRVPTLDGDEALHWYDYPSLALPGAMMGFDLIQSPAFSDTMNGNLEAGAPKGERKTRRPELSYFWRNVTRPKKTKKKHDLHALGF